MSDEAQPQRGWFQRLTEGLTRSSTKLTEGITSIFTKKKLDQAALDELEELLIAADLGPAMAARLTAEFGRNRFGKEVDSEEVKTALSEMIAVSLEPVAHPIDPDWGFKPYVIMVIGVNGAGKTTTIAKLAKQFQDNGKKVVIAAGDTFRAAAVEQLQVWGRRVGAPVIARETGSDSAALAYEAFAEARRMDADLLLIDTAGRLHNKTNLMGELEKISRVLKKHDMDAPHEIVLVLDGTTGQNALAQVETFSNAVPVTGLILTKLDGSAKGGVVVALAEKFELPIHAVGVGEGVEDLKPFTGRDFSRSLMGLGA